MINTRKIFYREILRDAADFCKEQPAFFSGFPHQGETKNPRSRFSLSNSASQTLVKFAVRLSELRAAVNSLFCFVSAGCCISNRTTLSGSEPAATVFCDFFQEFFRPVRGFKSHKEQGAYNTELRNRRKGFFKKIWKKISGRL